MEQEHGPQNVSATASQQTARILVIDDEPDVCDLLSQVLKRKGYAVDIANDGQQALARIKDNFYNLLITDLKMPKVDGMALLKEMKKKNPYVEAIVVTGYPTVELATEAMRIGAFDFMTKPIDVSKILDTVQSCLLRQKQESPYAREGELKSLLDITRKMTGYVNLDTFFENVFDLALDMSRAKRGSFLVFDEKTGEMSIKIAVGIDEEVMRNTRIKPGEGICGRVLEQDEPLLVQDIETDPRFQTKNKDQYRTKSFISIPMKSRITFPRENILGVLNLSDKDSGEAFTEREKTLLTILAFQAVAALDNHRLHEALQKAMDSLDKAQAKLYEAQIRFLENEKALTAGQLMLEVNYEVRESLEMLLDQVRIMENKNLFKTEYEHYVLDRTKKLVKKTNLILDRFLRHSRTSRLRIQEVDLTKTLNDVLSLIALYGRARNIVIEGNWQTGRTFILADLTLLRHALMNIGLHALSRIPEGGSLQVEVFPPQGEQAAVRIEITHQGKPLPESIKARLEDPFFIAGKDEEENVLGLSLAYLIFQRHDGSLKIEERENSSTTFIITLVTAA